MKKLIVLTVVVFALALLVAPAAQATTTIVNTGPGSINTVARISSNNTVVGGMMIGGVRNRSLAIGNTGLNFSVGNTIAGKIESGAVSSTTDNEAVVNYRSVGINQAANPSGNDDVVINTTGPGSINTVTTTNVKSVMVSGAMIGGISNGSLAVGNSGGNVSALNTIGGDIKTGGVTLKDTTLSQVNASYISITQ